MKYWTRLTHQQQDEIITKALQENIDYINGESLGVPASTLDDKVFYAEAPFLKDAPLLRAYVSNPNHIGCHTLGDSEPFFSGTQQIEREVISLLSEDMLHAEPDSCDGYVAAGGTEANMQAVWIYRNYFQQEMQATPESIALLTSQDTHYSVAKASNVFGIDLFYIQTEFTSRKIVPEQLHRTIQEAVAGGKKYFIVITNMATTMFGSIDDISLYEHTLQQSGVSFKIHVDGAFGGFIYPVSEPANRLDFSNPAVNSITLDAHKMLQAPYGTGIFLIRKNWMQYAQTKEATYVHGMDITLSGSRSGTNAIAIWMILHTYGYHGWLEKIQKLLFRTDRCCKALDENNIRYFRHPKMNIIAIQAKDLHRSIAAKYFLVPDTHNGSPDWYKIVVMDHVDIDRLDALINDIISSGKQV